MANASHASPLSDAGAASASSGSGSGSRSGGGGNGSNPSPSASAGSGSGGSVPYNAPSADSPYPADSTNSTSSASSSDTAQGQGHGQGQGLLRAYGRYDEIPIFARGVASTGTIEIIGADADPDVINGGVEGMVRIDVVMQYGGFQDVGSKVRVCEVVRGDGSIGVGVYVSSAPHRFWILEHGRQSWAGGRCIARACSGIAYGQLVKRQRRRAIPVGRWELTDRPQPKQTASSPTPTS